MNNFGKEEIKKKLNSNDIKEVTDTLLDITFNNEDWEFVQNECLKLLDNKITDISGLAITCLGHIARIHSKINMEKIIPRLNEKLNNPELYGRIEDALNDIKMFIKNDEKITMDKPRIVVDFNEMVTNKIVLMSKDDSKIDSEGNIIKFHEGMAVSIYSDDEEPFGIKNNLIADGNAIKYDLTKYPYWSHVKWCCLINKDGIRHELDNNINTNKI
jgi:hypothetical protein